MTLPTLITSLRFVLAPLFCVLVYDSRYGEAFVVLLLSGLSDLVDGYIARKIGRMTELGAILDPLADKVLMLLAFTTLSLKGYMSVAVSALVIGRDVLIVSGIVWCWIQRISIDYKPIVVSKWTTAFQILLLVQAFLVMYTAETGLRVFGLLASDLQDIQRLLYVVVSVLTVISGGLYARLGVRCFREGKRSRR